MKNAMRNVFILGGLCVLLSVTLALPTEEEESNKETRSPGVDENDFSDFQEQDDPPAEFSIGSIFSGGLGKFFNNFLQFPVTVFRFISGIIANQPFAKLREEVRNLNISYPKRR